MKLIQILCFVCFAVLTEGQGKSLSEAQNRGISGPPKKRTFVIQILKGKGKVNWVGSTDCLESVRLKK